MKRAHIPKSSSYRDKMIHYMENIVYGANDGIITTFVVISGVYGAKLPIIVIIILGAINLLADGFSMGASCFLSIRSAEKSNQNSRGVIEPIYHSLATFFSFVLFGLIPLLSYSFFPEKHKFLFSSIVTLVILFIVGSLRVFISPKKWLQGGLEMIAVGGLASAIAYGTGVLLSHVITVVNG